MTTSPEHEVDLAEYRSNNKSGVGIVGWQTQSSEGYWFEVSPVIVGTLRAGGAPIRPVYAIAPDTARQRDMAVEALREARTDLSITRSNIMVEMKNGSRAAYQWEGVPEKLKERLDEIDAALKACGVE